MQNRSRRDVCGLFIVITTACWVGCSEVDGWPHRKFDSTEWKRTPEADRYVFVKDLLASKTIIHKSAGEIINILDQPSSIGNESKSFHYVVKLGAEYSFSQVFILDIRFDPITNLSIGASIRGD